ncbi:MAG: nitroreductase family protein [Spirochaetales bacterium]|nr:nitroreductase family protein [Spirochaetales bacterium]
MDIRSLLELMRERKSTRNFEADRHIPHVKEQLILEAARLAPSAGNNQTWHFFIVKDLQKKQKIAEAAFGQHFIVQAPLVVIAAINKKRATNGYGKRGIELYAIQDTAAAIEHMLLAARAQGIGSCWIGAFSEDALYEAVGIEREHYRPVAIIPFGYSLDDPPNRGRHPLKQIVTEL